MPSEATNSEVEDAQKLFFMQYVENENRSIDNEKLFILLIVFILGSD